MSSLSSGCRLAEFEMPAPEGQTVPRLSGITLGEVMEICGGCLKNLIGRKGRICRPLFVNHIPNADPIVIEIDGEQQQLFPVVEDAGELQPIL
jgi:hypothetical protein